MLAAQDRQSLEPGPESAIGWGIARLIVITLYLLGLLALGAAPAGAEPRDSMSGSGPGPIGIIARTPADAPVGHAELIAALARAGLAEGLQVLTQPFARAQAGAGRPLTSEQARFLAQAEALTRDGWRAYLAAEPERAATLLGAARDAARQVLATERGLAAYADLVLRLGAVELHLGRADAAAALFRLAHALAPGRAVTMAEFTPDVVEAHGTARSADLPRTRVRVTAEPAEARIFVDGSEAGIGAALLELAPGPHVVVGRARGFAAVGQEIVIPAGAGASADNSARPVHLELVRDPEAAAVWAGPAALAVGMAAADAEVALAGLLRHGELGSVALVAAVWRRGTPALIGQLCAGMPVGCTRVVEIGYARPEDTQAAAAALWRALVTSARPGAPVLLGDARLVRAESRPATPARLSAPGRAPRRCTWCRSPWLWAGVGTALATAGAIWLARSPEESPVITVDPCEFGGCMRP